MASRRCGAIDLSVLCCEKTVAMCSLKLKHLPSLKLNALSYVTMSQHHLKPNNALSPSV